MSYRTKNKYDQKVLMETTVDDKSFLITKKGPFESEEEKNENQNNIRKKSSNKYKDTQTVWQPFDMFQTPTSKIFLLIFLYILQGVPLGLGASLPYLLQARKVSYKDQALFSLIYLPFSLKLFWAPLVDSIYHNSMGRRKSWLIPTQYFIGLSMFFLSSHIENFMGNNPEKHVSVGLLTAIFFFINFLAATQDIAVDGWALTMLGKTFSNWVSTCNTVGQTIGFVLGNLVFLSLESEEFSNAYLRSSPAKGGVVTFSSYLYFCSVVFFISTTMVWIMKRESRERDEEQMHITKAYHLLYKIICLPSVLKLIAILLTLKIAFGATDAISSLKLVDAGVPKEKLAMLGSFTIPLNIVLPILITRFTSQNKPLSLLLYAYFARLMLDLVFMVVVSKAPDAKVVLDSGETTFATSFYAISLFLILIHESIKACIYVPMMTFFASISDPSIGGTYMTLLNTMSNLGSNWPQTLSLWLVDNVGIKGCLDADGSCLFNAICSGSGICTYLDGYYVLVCLCTAIGVVWLFLASGPIMRLQSLRPAEWAISRSRR